MYVYIYIYIYIYICLSLYLSIYISIYLSISIYGHDMISIRMIKLCGISVCKPLEIIFQNCLHSKKSLSEWEKANVVPTFKRGDKQCIKIIV